MSLRRNARVLLNDGWLFRFLEDPGPGELVSLPHSWNALDTMEIDPAQHYRRSVGVYRRRLPAQAMRQDERLWIEFEAASQKARVELNGRLVAEHLGGYTAFVAEIGQADEASDLIVQVDNRPDQDLIPSDLSDFFLYGGLTRNVWLYKTGPARIAAAWVGAELKPGIAVLTVHGRVDGDLKRGARLALELRDPAGALVTQTEVSIGSPEFSADLGAILSPRLWSPERPDLYWVSLRLVIEDELSDQVDISAGLRRFRFSDRGLFELNGRALRLHGTHRHEDWAGHGGAVPDDLTRREMELIREAGFNFVRLGHYPQAEVALDCCDELGLIVWEELPWCRGGVGEEVFKERARQMLTEMIEQHRRHPSIVFWGLGNELDWEASDHPGSTEARVLEFLTELHDLAKRLDPERLTALRRFSPGASVVDAYSPSIWSGWYRGRYEDYATILEGAVQRFPHMLHVEWGGDSHVGRHGTGPHVPELPLLADHGERPGDAALSGGEARAASGGDWSESYMLDLMEWHLRVQLNSERLAGNAQWIFKDFGTPLRPGNPIPYVNQKGLVDRAGRPKDTYYLFKSYLSDEPTVFIESPTWAVRTGAEADPQRLRVYSNCRRVELFLNGESLGVRNRDPRSFPAAGLVWQVRFRFGRNDLRAVGEHTGGRTCVHALSVTYETQAQGPGVRLSSAVDAVATDGGDLATRIALQICDRNGRPVVDDRRRISLRLFGPGRLLTRQGTVDGSCVVELANGRATAWVLEACQGASELHVAVLNGPEMIVRI